MRRPGLVAVTALIAAGCGGDDSGEPAPRPGLIVPQKSIDRVAIGMTPRAVREIYGKPDRIEPLAASDAEDVGEGARTWSYERLGLTVDMRSVEGKPPAVAALETTSDRYRTAKGARVGDSEDQLVQKVDGTDCDDLDGGRWCTLGSTREGRPQTVFELKDDRITTIRIILVFG